MDPVTSNPAAPVAAPIIAPIAAPITAPVAAPPTTLGTPAVDPGVLGGPATAENAWKLGLTPEHQADPTIKDTATINDVVQRLIDTKKMVGADKIIKLGENATPDERRLWMKDNLNVSRPDDAKGYNFDMTVAHPDFKDQMGATMEHVAQTMFDLDISMENGQALTKAFLENESRMYEAAQVAMVQAEETAILGLKQELGQSFDHKIGIVKHVLQQADPTGEATKLLDDSRLGNNPAILKMLIRFAENMGGDNLATPDVSQGRSFITSPEQAVAEIGQLQQDADFRKKLTDKMEPGHKEAVAKWTQLHDIKNGVQ